MSDIIKPWRAQQFGRGYSAEWLPPGQRSWRIVKSGGSPIVFATRSEALGAAENAYVQRVEGHVRATLPVDPERLEAKLNAEAESWLRTSREDRKKAETQYRPGRKPLFCLPGRAS
jgi:hypothetical protein